MLPITLATTLTIVPFQEQNIHKSSTLSSAVTARLCFAVEAIRSPVLSPVFVCMRTVRRVPGSSKRAVLRSPSHLNVLGTGKDLHLRFRTPKHAAAVEIA